MLRRIKKAPERGFEPRSSGPQPERMSWLPYPGISIGKEDSAIFEDKLIKGFVYSACPRL